MDRNAKDHLSQLISIRKRKRRNKLRGINFTLISVSTAILVDVLDTFFFPCSGRERGSQRRHPGGGVGAGRVCAGNFWGGGGGLIFFFRGRNARQVIIFCPIVLYTSLAQPSQKPKSRPCSQVTVRRRDWLQRIIDLLVGLVRGAAFHHGRGARKQP